MVCHDPKLTPSGCEICKSPELLEYHPPDGQVYGGEHIGLRITDLNELIVSCKGSFRENSDTGPQAAIGIWFEEDSPYNIRESLPEALPKSKEAAELWAAFRSIEEGFKHLPRTIERPHGGGGKSHRTLIIATDSNYVYSGMTQLIKKWRDNEFRNSKGKLLHDTALYLMLDEIIHALREHRHIHVKFWHRQRHSIKGAELLSSEAYNTPPISDNTLGEILETMDRDVLQVLGTTLHRSITKCLSRTDNRSSRVSTQSWSNLTPAQRSAITKIQTRIQESMLLFSRCAPFLYLFLPGLIDPVPCFFCVISGSVHYRLIGNPELTPAELEAVKGRQSEDSALSHVLHLTPIRMKG